VTLQPGERVLDPHRAEETELEVGDARAR
jgi:hypothetical protein